MEIKYSPHFRKQYQKAPQKVKNAFKKRQELFLKNSQSPLLRTHQLSGKLKKYKSINVTGDWRAIYSENKKRKIIVFEFLGTHSQLYR